MTPVGVDVAEGSVEASPGRPEVPIRRYQRREGPTPRAPTLLWVHGGGFFSGGLDQPEADAVARVVAAAGFPTVTVDYRLVPPPGMAKAYALLGRPINRHPAPFDDVAAVLRDVSSETGRVVLGGASAGACLAASVALNARRAGAPALQGVALAYGFFHQRMPRDRTITVPGIRRVTHSAVALDVAIGNYIGRSAPSVPPAFCGGEDLSTMAPTLMLDAEHDAIRASGERFADELRAADVPLERHVLAHSQHAFLDRPGTDHFDQGTALLCDWLSRVDPAAGDG